MKIILFKIGALGDVLMTTPLVRQLRKNFPNAKIDYLVGDYSKVVLERNKYLDEILTFDSMIFVKKKIFKWIKLIRSIRKRRYDVIFVLDKHWIFNLTAFLFGIKRRVGFDRLGKEGIFLTDKVYYGPVRHEVYYYLDLLKNFGYFPDYKDVKYDLFLTKEDEMFASKFWKEKFKKGEKVLGVFPGVGNPMDKFARIRAFDFDLMARLCKKYLKRGWTLLLFGSKNDLEYGNKLICLLRQKIKMENLIGKLTLTQTAALAKRCDQIITWDSGGMHIAAAVNKRILAIFGPTHPRKKAPRKAEIVRLKEYYIKIYELKGRLLT